MQNMCQIRTMMFVGSETIRGYDTAYFQVIDSEKQVRIGFVWEGRLDWTSLTVSEAKDEFKRLALTKAKGKSAVEVMNDEFNEELWQEEIDDVV